MMGLSLQDLKKHPALIPLYMCLGLGVTFATFYSLRMALKSPDVSLNRGANPEPHSAYKNKQYKFFSPNLDYSTYKVPTFDDIVNFDEKKIKEMPIFKN